MSFTAILDANISKFSQAIDRAQAQMDGLEVGINAKLNRIGDSFTSLGRKASLFSAAYAAAIGLSIKKGIDFESAFAGVEKTVDGTATQMAQLREGIKEMSKELPTSASDIAAVAEAAGQLGIQTDNILAFSKVMIDLGEASNMSSEQAATALARFANITQMSQNQFDRLGSVIAELGNNLATTESEIVEMGLRLAGTGSQIGLTEAQILSLAGALSSVGIEAQAGGSSFSRMMVNMQLAVETGGQKLQDFANVAGMTASEFQTAFRNDAAGAIISFIEGLSKVEERGETAIAVLDKMGITEIRLRDALLRAAGASDVFRDSIELGSKAWDENIALTEEAERRYATSASKFKMLLNRIQGQMVRIGEILLPMFNDFVDRISNLVDWFAKLDPVIIKVGLAVGALLATVGPLLLMLGGILKAIPLITAAITVMSGPIGWAIAGITALTAGIVAFSSTTNGATSATDAFAKAQDQANKSITREISELNKLLSIAKNENLSKEVRAKAIRTLNALSPKYLGDLKLETINTAATTVAVEKYTKALSDNARQKAVNDKMTELYADLLKQEENLIKQQAGLSGIERKGGDLYKMTEYRIKLTEKSIDKIKEQITYYEGLVEVSEEGSNSIVGDLKTIIDEFEDLITITEDSGEVTMDAFQKMIGETTPLQQAIELTTQKIEDLQSKLIKLQTGILTPTNVRKEIEQTKQDIGELSSALDLLTGERELNIDVKTNGKTIQDFLNSDFFSGLGKSANLSGLKASFSKLFGEDGLTLPEVDASRFEASLQKANEMVIDYGQMMAMGMSGLAQAIGDAFGSGNFDNLGSNLISAMGNLAKQFGSMLMAMGAAALELQSLITNPWTAIAAGAALVALGAAATASAQRMVNNTISGGAGSYQNIPTGPGLSDQRGPYRGFEQSEVIFKIGTNELIGVLDQHNTRKIRMR